MYLHLLPISHGYVECRSKCFFFVFSQNSSHFFVHQKWTFFPFVGHEKRKRVTETAYNLETPNFMRECFMSQQTELWNGALMTVVWFEYCIYGTITERIQKLFNASKRTNRHFFVIQMKRINGSDHQSLQHLCKFVTGKMSNVQNVHVCMCFCEMVRLI